LEFNSFGGVLSLALGYSQRIAQEKGPLEIKFKDSEHNYYTYLNVDGEYFKIERPDMVKLQLSNDFPLGKLRILTRKPN